VRPARSAGVEESAMHEHLDVAYHQQDTDSYCGAACAQMVLRALGQPLLAQANLFTDNQAHTVEGAAWLTAPDGLCWTLNNRQAAKRFTLDSTDTEEPISRTICWSIHHYQCAPVALVYNGNHWLVVRGYSATAAPSSAFDTAYTIQSFDLNNPFPPVPALPGPPPHSDNDVCVSGGNRGVADINVSYATWQSDYLLPNTFGAVWLGRYVAVCDPDPTDARPPGGPTTPPQGAPLTSPAAAHSGGSPRPLDAAFVRENLVARLSSAGLMSHPLWSKVFEQVRTGEPMLVQRLDREDRYYWIVPTQDDRGTARAAVAVDAYTGDYQQALSIRDQQSSMFGFAPLDRVRDHVLGRRFALPAAAGAAV
jgi:hypothetical protein